MTLRQPRTEHAPAQRIVDDALAAIRPIVAQHLALDPQAAVAAAPRLESAIHALAIAVVTIAVDGRHRTDPTIRGLTWAEVAELTGSNAKPNSATAWRAYRTRPAGEHPAIAHEIELIWADMVAAGGASPNSTGSEIAQSAFPQPNPDAGTGSG